MADYDRSTNPSSAQYRTLLEIVDDVLAWHESLEILRVPSAYLTTELTRRDIPGRIQTEPIDETERRTR